MAEGEAAVMVSVPSLAIEIYAIADVSKA